MASFRVVVSKEGRGLFLAFFISFMLMIRSFSMKQKRINFYISVGSSFDLKPPQAENQS